MRSVLSCLLILALASTGLSTPGARAESGDYQTGTRLYKEGKWKAAGVAFLKAARTQNDSFNANYLAANSLFRAGDQEHAMQLYWYLLRKYPSRRETYSIRAFLKKYDRHYNQHATDTTFGSALAVSTPGEKNAPSDGPGREKRDAVASAKSTLSKDALIDDFVKVVRPLKQRPPVSATLISNVKEALKRYPENLLRLVWSRGCRIFLTPTLIDKDPEYEHTRPRGYEFGHTFKDCPGMFTGREIVICEYTIGNGFDVDSLSDPVGTLRHELGHAVDYFLGRISSTEEYKHAYYLDMGRIAPEDKPSISYYLQKSSGGPSETFAELMCGKFGGRAENSRTQKVASSFKLTMAVIEKHLARYDNGR